MNGQLQFEFLKQEAELKFGLSIAGEDQFAAVGGRQVHVDVCMAANFSSTLRGVSPGASACKRRASVTCRQ